MPTIIDQNPGLFDDLHLPNLMGTNPNEDALIVSVARPFSQPLNRAQKKIKKELSKHTAAIEGVSEKTSLVINQRVKLQQHGANAFLRVVVQTENLKSQYQTGEYKAMFDQFLLASVQTTGKNILGFEHLAAGLMSEQIQRDLDPPPQSLRERIFG